MRQKCCPDNRALRQGVQLGADTNACRNSTPCWAIRSMLGVRTSDSKGSGSIAAYALANRPQSSAKRIRKLVREVSGSAAFSFGELLCTVSSALAIPPNCATPMMIEPASGVVPTQAVSIRAHTRIRIESSLRARIKLHIGPLNWECWSGMRVRPLVWTNKLV